MTSHSRLENFVFGGQQLKLIDFGLSRKLVVTLGHSLADVCVAGAVGQSM